MERYKAVVSNNKIYREIELAPTETRVQVGTQMGCECRLSAQFFFEDFSFAFENDDDVWVLVCGDNNYVSTDGILKLTSKEMRHGDELVIKYKSTNQEICSIYFTLDFDYENKDFERVIDIAGLNRIDIGGQPRCDIHLLDPLIAGEAFSLISQGDSSLLLQDINTKYGVYANGVRIQDNTVIKDYDFFSVVGYSFFYRYGKLYTSGSSALDTGNLNVTFERESQSEFQYPHFNRSTRIKHLVPNEEIPVLPPPQAPTEPEQNIIVTLMPALLSGVVMIVMRYMMAQQGNSSNMGFIYMSIATVILGVVTSVLGFVQQKRKFRKTSKERIEKYTEYLAEKEIVLDGLREAEREILEDVYYSPHRELQFIEDFSSSLFDRVPDDDDFLRLRVGTGSAPTNQPVGYKEQETFEVEDKLIPLPAALAERYRHLFRAPITLDALKAGAIGVVGNQKGLYEMMKILLLDVCSRHYYNDLQVFFLIDEENVDKLAWIRFLPHLQNDILNMRNIVCDTDSKNILFEYLYKEFSYREVSKAKTPHIMLFVYDDVGIKNHPLSRYIADAAEYGVTFIFFEKSKDFLPIGCTEVLILADEETSGTLVSSEDNTSVLNFSYEPIDDMQADFFAKKMAPICCEEISLEAALTKNITLYELLEITSSSDIDIAKRWKESEIHKTMAAPLGVDSKNEVVCLDLHEKYHGPHGLVAGTTGSGKSEILQSYILSMATLFHPYEVGFVIIDFKGGGMVNQFLDLPHLVGSITNIDGREIERSLLSIKAELRKRQELFYQHDVNHINAYIQLFKKGEAKIPLPHLILIVDEFAELKMDQPEFMKELISASRIGRSLGMHLILATQKPSGVVDAQIWSNSKFKLCLKVQNREDSNEVLKSPLAAEIKEPGRAYLQVGNNEIFELFQSAYSGAPANTDAEVKKKFAVHAMKLSGQKSMLFEQKPDKSSAENYIQLDAIVEHVAEFCTNSGIERLPGICLPPLREMIPYSEATRVAALGEYSLTLPLGIYDDPDNQLQTQANLDLFVGNTFLVGASQFGKTAMLQSIIRSMAESYTPQEITIYILDFASMALKIFETLPHVGGVVTPSEDIKLKTFFQIISREIAMRREKFAKMGITSFSSYKEGGYTDLPFISILLDNVTAFRELYEIYDDTLLYICREGLAVGIGIIATAPQTRSLSYRYLSNFSSRIALYCNQREEYGTMFDFCRMEPKSVPGRALISINKQIYEYQNYLPFEGEKEIERVENIRKFILQIIESIPVPAKRIPEVPDLLTVAYLEENMPRPIDYHVPIGMDYNTVDIVSVDLASIGCLVLSGRKKSGKTNFIRYMIFCLEKESAPAQVYIADSYERRLEELNKFSILKEYTTTAEVLEQRVQFLEAECGRRMEMLKDGGLHALENEQLLMLLINGSRFFEADSLSKSCLESLKKISKSGKDVRICMVIGNYENTPIPYGAPDFLKQIKENKNTLFFDDLVEFKLFDLASPDIRNNKKEISLGDAFYIAPRAVYRMKTPYLPDNTANQ